MVAGLGLIVSHPVCTWDVALLILTLAFCSWQAASCVLGVSVVLLSGSP